MSVLSVTVLSTGVGTRSNEAFDDFCQMKEGRAELKRKIPVPRASYAAGRADNSENRRDRKCHETALAATTDIVKT